MSEKPMSPHERAEKVLSECKAGGGRVGLQAAITTALQAQSNADETRHREKQQALRDRLAEAESYGLMMKQALREILDTVGGQPRPTISVAFLCSGVPVETALVIKLEREKSAASIKDAWDQVALADERALAFQAQAAELRRALERLFHECRGMVGVAERAMRYAAGNTNVSVFLQRLEESYAALALIPGEALAKHDGLANYMREAREFSARTFGPGRRTLGVTKHIEKEIAEVRAKPDDLTEWVDLIMLAADGYWRHGGQPENLLADMMAKLAKNKARTWPAPTSVDEPIEHDRSHDTAPAEALERETQWEPCPVHGCRVPDGDCAFCDQQALERQKATESLLESERQTNHRYARILDQLGLLHEMQKDGDVDPLERVKREAMQRMLDVARGCHDYGGGFRGTDKFDAYQAGIATVVSALEHRIKDNADTQCNALEQMGRAAELRKESE